MAFFKIFKNRKIRIVIWTGLAGIISLLAIFLVGLSSANAGKVAYGLSVADLKIGGLTNDLAASVLQNQLDAFTQKKLTIVFQSSTWELTPQELGLSFNSDQALDEASSIGHQSNPLANITDQVITLIARPSLALNFTLDSKKFTAATAKLTKIEQPATNAAFKYNAKNNNLEIIPGEAGQIVNRAQLLTAVIDNFNKPQPQPILLSLSEAPPAVTLNDLTLTANDAQAILDRAPYWLQTADATWKIDKAELADWLSASPAAGDPPQAKITLKENGIKDFLLPLVPSVNREPIDAQLTSEREEIKFVTLAQKGQRLNVARSIAQIQTKILAGERNIALVVDLIEPKISNTNLGDLGVVKLLGRGESNFVGSPTNRKKNIALGAAKLHGLLIKPDEEFSFVQSIDEIDETNGWLPELVIKNNQTLPEFGGGICQVSTTLFRAAVNSGLKITERHPHAYPVKYYNPPGFDATVYPPSPNFRFLNDTANNILLQTKISGTKLIFEVYGTPDGREVKIKGPTITQKNTDGSLKTILTQEIWRDGQKVAENVFRSAYKSADLYPIVTPTPTP